MPSRRKRSKMRKLLRRAAVLTLLAALLIPLLFVTLVLSMRHPGIYCGTPVAVRFSYHLADHKLKVHGQRLLHWLFFSRSTSTSLDPGPYVLLNGEYRPVLEKPRIRLTIPPKAQLSMGFATGTPSPRRGSEPPPTVRITLHEDQNEHLLYAGPLPEPGRWQDVTADLSSFADQEVELRYFVVPFVEGTRFTPPHLSSTAPDGRPNVIVIVLDTLRASRLGAYGYSTRPASPSIDRLAAGGAHFLNATSNSVGTFSSHMALLTGLYPSVSHVSYRNWHRKSRARDAWAAPTLAPSLTTFPQLLADNGYYTLAFTSGYLMMQQVGYHRGFDRVIDSPPHSFGDLTSMAQDWLAVERIEPFFMYLHSYEPHSPYEDRRFVPSSVPGTEGAINEASYVGDIRSADDALGHFLGWLEEQGLKERTLLILTSDHGEEFADHFPVYSAGHGHSLYDEQVRVPLVFSHPSIPPARLVKQVQLVDVRPTLMNWLDIEDPSPVSGTSLASRLRTGREDQVQERLAFAEDTSYGPEWKMLRNSSYKYIYLPTPWKHDGVGWGGWKAYLKFAYTDRHQLFDLALDPGEKTNVYGSREDLADFFSGEMERVLSANRLAADRFRNRLKESELSEEALRGLRSLGYIE